MDWAAETERPLDSAGDLYVRVKTHTGRKLPYFFLWYIFATDEEWIWLLNRSETLKNKLWFADSPAKQVLLRHLKLWIKKKKWKCLGQENEHCGKRAWRKSRDKENAILLQATAELKTLTILSTFLPLWFLQCCLLDLHLWITVFQRWEICCDFFLHGNTLCNSATLGHLCVLKQKLNLTFGGTL